jgi:pSer/pThr/pTyr-binding forkhead associated (FHA) protein
MAETVRLTVLTGPHKGRRYCFRGPTSCLVGRADDCSVRFAGSERDQSISRHHCQLNIDPPCVRLQDLGSRNGTYLNGRAVGGKAAKDTAALLRGGSPIAPVEDGAIITIGGTSFTIEIVDSPPRPPEGTEHDPVWQPDAVVKQDCPVRC